MRYLLSFSFVLVALFVIIIPMITPVVASALDSEFISANEIAPGMKGYALAQFYGDKIEQFDVEIIGVYGRRHQTKGYFRRMLAVVSGGSLEISRGISTGFSGAPVYLDGRLAGAIESTPAWGAKNFVTIVSIEEMMTLFDMPSMKSISTIEPVDMESDEVMQTISLSECAKVTQSDVEIYVLDKSVTVEGIEISSIAIADSPTELQKLKSDKTTLAMVRCGGVVTVFDPASSNYCVIDEVSNPPSNWSDAFNQYANEDVVSVNSTANESWLMPTFGTRGAEFPSLHTTPPFSESYFPIGNPIRYSQFIPGAMVSIPLVRGDMEATLNGTLTYVDSIGRFIAFAHAIDGAHGSVRLPIARTHVYTTHTQLQENYSIVKCGDIVGTIYEDRNSGSAGKLTVYEDYFPVHVSLTSVDSKFTAESNVEIVKSARHYRDWLPNSVGYMLERTADEWGEGTVHYLIKFKIVGIDSQLTIEDTSYSQWDWRSEIISRIRNLAYKLTSNELSELVLEWVDVTCEFTSSERTARIADVEFGTLIDGSFKPFVGQPNVTSGAHAKLKIGDSYAVDFKLIYPDGGEGQCYIESTIPEGYSVGKARIQLRGGATRMPVDRGLTPYLMQSYYKELDSFVRYFEPTAPKTINELIEEIELFQNGGQAVLEILSTGKGMRNERGRLPRCFSAATSVGFDTNQPDFQWLDFRGCYTFEIEIAI